jgi:hypothetical protein
MGGINLYGDMPRAIAGAKYGLHDETETLIAGERIFPGEPVFGMVGDSETCYGAHVNSVSLTASEELVDGNSVAVTINGIEIAPVVFINNSLDTIKAIVQAINLDDGADKLGISAFLVDGVPLAFYLEGPGVEIEASAVVTGGEAQAVFDSSAYTNAVFLGVARHEELSYREGTGFYPAQSAVNVQTRGKVWVQVDDEATPEDKEAAYVIGLLSKPICMRPCGRGFRKKSRKTQSVLPKSMGVFRN